MKYNNMKLREFWYGLSTTDRKLIADKANVSIGHVAQIVQGNRKLGLNVGFRLIHADKRITIKMCFPDGIK
jgi:hypothetical protein